MTIFQFTDWGNDFSERCRCVCSSIFSFSVQVNRRWTGGVVSAVSMCSRHRSRVSVSESQGEPSISLVNNRAERFRFVPVSCLMPLKTDPILLCATARSFSISSVMLLRYDSRSTLAFALKIPCKRFIRHEFSVTNALIQTDIVIL